MTTKDRFGSISAKASGSRSVSFSVVRDRNTTFRYRPQTANAEPRPNYSQTRDSPFNGAHVVIGAR
jgi:hypothetical protein